MCPNLFMVTEKGNICQCMNTLNNYSMFYEGRFKKTFQNDIVHNLSRFLNEIKLNVYFVEIISAVCCAAVDFTAL